MSEHNILINHFMKTAKELCWPVNVTLEITLQCQLRCRHCYNFDRQTPRKAESQLSHEQWHDVISQLAAAGALNLTFTGGEPLLNPNLEEYIQFARTKHFITNVKTNAVLLDERRIAKLKAAGLNDIQISLYGATDKTYERFTDIKQGFSKVRANVVLLLKQGLRPVINIILHRYNVPELSQMIHFCESQNLSPNISLEITDRQDKTATGDYVLTREQYTELMRGPHQELFLGDNPDGGLQCPCATTNCAIACNGDVLPCIGAPIKAGSVLEQPFIEIWKNSELFCQIRGIKNEDFKDCFTCPDKLYCQRSSGSAYMNTGNYLGKDPRTCEVSQIRHQILRNKRADGCN